ncbi:MAG: glycosyltransferase family 39 protein [Archaeoglobaceae archaeon]|nr:glycosyltransferase family 39 protein [Archaeoglobaceae archaeon]MDW8118492.1 glycosyltransferase family 39 protein [Archaeoglobaceae archaeon]
MFLNFFGYPDLLLALIPPTGLLIISFEYKKYRIPAIAFFISTLLLFKPIYRFEDWAGIYALKLVNLIAISLTAEILYRMLRENVSDRIAISAVIIFIFATPVAYWSLSAKLHALSLLIISLSFYFLDKFLKKEKFRDLFISSFFAGFSFFLRAMEGIIISSAIFLFLFLFKRQKILYAIPAMALGYLPCAIFGLAVFGIPLPVEIIGNRFSNVSYIEVSSFSETVSLTPLIFLGINNKTLGLLSYSPVLALLIPPIFKALKSRKISLSPFEKFLLIFTFLCLIIYLPYLKDGVVETGVRDYRFLLPIYLPFTFFLARLKVEVETRSLLLISLCLIIPTIFFVTLLNQFLDQLKFGYLLLSTALAILFIFIEKFKKKSEILSLSILPIIFIISDLTGAYFSPYDVHFVNPIIDRLVEFLIWLKG